MVRNKLISVILTAFILSITLLPIAVLAQEEPEKTISQTIDEKLELTGVFFSSALDTENFFTPFDDFFDQNECKRLLVFSLRQKRDRLGNVIRKAVLNSEITVSEVRQMVMAWEVTSGELYFVRNIERIEKPGLISETNLLYPGNELLKLRSKTWPTKYESEFKRIENCQSGWADIIQKWRQFTKDVSEASDNISKALSGVYKESEGLVTDIYENPIDTLTPLDEAGLKSLYTDKKDLEEGEEFDFSNYLQVDFGPVDSLQKEYNEKTKRIKELMGKDPVALQVALNGQNVSLVELATGSLNSSNLVDQTIDDLLDATQSDIEYGYVDAIINLMISESEQTQQTVAGASSVLEEGIIPALAQILDRQCRSSE